MKEGLSDNLSQAGSAKDPRKVFVVHGRNGEARDALFQFLRSIGLHPVEWLEAIEATGEASPYIGRVLEVAFEEAQAIIVLMTPDDEARLREMYRKDDDELYEINLTPQARPNVLFEAGMAMGRSPTRTVLVELGKLRPFSDIGGRHTVRLSNATQSRQQLAQRLSTAGCPVNLSGIDWHTVGNFDAGATVTGRPDTMEMPASHKLSGSDASTGLDLRLSLEAKPRPGGMADRASFNLIVTLNNVGAVRADDYWVDVYFPVAFLNTNTLFWLEVREARTQTHWLFRHPHEGERPKLIYPNSVSPVMTIEFSVNNNDKQALKQMVRASVQSNRMRERVLEKSMAEFLMN